MSAAPVPLIRDGKARALSVASGQRIAALAGRGADRRDLPELQGDDLVRHRRAAEDAARSPPSCPPRHSVDILRMPDVVRRIHDSYGTPVGGSPADTATIDPDRDRALAGHRAGGGIKPE